MIGASAGATINFALSLYHGRSLKDALSSAAQGFGSGAVSGAISGAFGGLTGGAASAEGAKALTKVMGSSQGQWALRTLGDTAGNLGDRALNGEKITAGDVVFSLATNAAFNGAPIAFNKVKGTKAGQVVGGKISSARNAVKEKAGSIVSKAAEGIGNKTSVLKGNLGNAVSGVKGKFAGGKSAVSRGGKTSGKVWDYSKQFNGELSNFNDGYNISDVVDKDMYLVQFHSGAEVGSGRSLKYWTTIDEANGISTVDEYMNKMALLSDWGARDNVSTARIPAGTKIKHAVGTAKKQLSPTETRPGGGVQILFEYFDDS